MTEKEKMLANKIYDPNDDELLFLRTRAHHYCLDYNHTYDEEDTKRKEILDVLMPNRGENTYLQGPIFFDYGINIYTGKNFYANFNFTCLDVAKVVIGNDVFFGPNVSLLTPMHPFLPNERAYYINEKHRVTDKEYSKEIHIGDNCWVCGNVTIIGGVTIGEGSIIGAGSVVTKSIPPHSLACGNPCKVIRKITDQDSIYLKKELF